MKVRRLDKNHDWTFGAGLVNYALDSEAISQRVKTALLSLFADWFMDMEHGIKWFNHLLKNPDLQTMETELKTSILHVNGIVRLTNFGISMDVDTRNCTVTVSYIDMFDEENEVSIHAPDY